MSAKRGERQSSTNRLRQADHVRRHAEIFARASAAKFGTGFHFVENQQGAVLIANIAQPLQEAGLRQAEADVHQDRFKNDRGNLTRIFFEAAFDRIKIVEGRNLHVLDRGLRNAQATRNRCGSVNVAVIRRVRFHADQRAIVQPVIGAFELDDLVASRCGAGSRTACIVASVPELPKRHISIGKRLQISSASSHSMSCGMPYMVPVESRFSTAFITAGWQCPAISAPKVRLWS